MAGIAGAGRADPAPASSPSMRPASVSTVGVSNTARTATSTPNTVRSREATWVASSECPPSAKKSAAGPTRSRLRTSAKMPATSSSVGVRGAPPVSSLSAGSSGRAARALATSDVLPDESRRGSTAAERTAPCASSAASISPSSMRKPRTFTWLSRRPR